VRNGDASVALTNMGATPIRARGVEGSWSGDAAVAAEAAAEGTEPTDEVSASAGFKQHLARVLVQRALEEATSR
jgi:carbon-monoxide dehydrogenase medium subunit